MTPRQQILKLVYPVWMAISKAMGKRTHKIKKPGTMNTTQSFYQLSASLNNGKQLEFASFKGKKVLVVNTASDCGYTPQYKDLQRLSEEYPGKLVVIGFPANDFKEQEKGSDEEIAAFCERNYGVTFPLVKKSSVVKGPQQHPVFRWLTHKELNGWNDQEPGWNFSKYLVSEDGTLVAYFDAGVSPASPEILKLINS